MRERENDGLGRGREPAPPANLNGKKLSAWKYNHSPKRYATLKRYFATAKGRAARQRYNHSDKGKSSGIRYNRSLIGRLMRKTFAQQPEQRVRYRMNTQARRNGY